MSEEHKPFGWWYSPTYKPVKDGYFVGYKESVEYIKSVLNEQGPFDGILGFSQGACFAALLTELLETRNPNFNHPPFKLAILVSGFKPIVQEATNSMLTKENKLKTPSLHYIGDFDTLVLPKTMLALTEAFENPVVFRHSGGHYLPSTPTSKKAFIQFLDTIKAGTLSPNPDRATIRLESE
ncbi:hypothetical protein CU098_012117 [Rhizopus stolonifer]|uniref:Serine hydrolase domain-containing protein n=1 Tax=Rhizopus stolonifer TaxID=4846 RepID=A0A367KPV2_RHIST|nr:hypothetical protein CU098_012117 [Rhizopus stolonifer]